VRAGRSREQWTAAQPLADYRRLSPTVVTEFPVDVLVAPWQPFVGTLAVLRVARSGPEHRGIRMAYRSLPG
jgi:hypothetical protein